MALTAVQSAPVQHSAPQKGIIDDVKDILLTPGDLKDAIEGVATCFDWIPYFTDRSEINTFAERASSELDVRNAFHFVNFIGRIGTLRKEYNSWMRGDDTDSVRRLFNAATLSVFNATGAVLFLDAINVICLGGLFSPAKATFWGTLGSVDSVGIFHNLSQLDTLRVSLQEAKSSEMKNILQHRINSVYLSILQCITTVAMAAIALVGILFASMAQGVIFSPVVMLGLSTAWLVLNFTNFFYSRMIDRAEEGLLVGTT